MHPQAWTEDHGRLLVEAKPVVPEATDAELARTWNVVRAGMENTPSRPRRKRRFVVAGVVVAVLAVPGGLAVADEWTAHTGRYPADAEDLRLGGPGEKLDVTAPDYGKVIGEETRDIPFPSEEAREISRLRLVKDEQHEPPGQVSVSTGGMRFQMARAAVCAWADEWAAATNAGDNPGRARATDMLDDAVTWPAVTDVDPEQVTRYERMTITDPRTGRSVVRNVAVDNTPAGYFPLVQKAAHGTDVDAMGAVLAFWGVCAPALVPDLPQALDVDRAVRALQAVPQD